MRCNDIPHLPGRNPLGFKGSISKRLKMVLADGMSQQKLHFADQSLENCPMAKLRKMFDAKARREIKKITSSCNDYRVLCQLKGEDVSILVTGTVEEGSKHGVTVELSSEWIDAATCSGQFVAGVIENIRELLPRGPKLKQRQDLLDRIFVHAALLPLLDRS